MNVYTNPDELRLAALNLRRSLRRYDESEPEDARVAALEAEAAVRRYICLLTKRKKLLRSQEG